MNPATLFEREALAEEITVQLKLLSNDAQQGG